MSMGYVSWFSRDMVSGRGWIALAAEAMGLHRNTVINRIRKIEELLGADLADADTAAAFQLGLELRELAGGGEGGHGHG